MEAFSTQLLVVAIFAYLVAMICHAAAFAAGNRAGTARPAVQPARELVVAGGGPVPADLPGPPAADGSARSAPAPGRSSALGRAAVGVTALAAAVHLADR
ncbi:MAG TPA: c-type cytochrome biogenesis protein CcsB, partial [Micromonosporaceae bacterium]|nr:c-type cytochrome biogenesis protein CcsB [Micromonosporaceae bacterium]